MRLVFSLIALLAAMDDPNQMMLPHRTVTVIEHPKWVTPHSGNDLADLYPERAQRMSQSGAAAVKCRVTIEGDLADCVIVSESPPGFGFGLATLRAASRWRMEPATRNGVPVEAVVTVPIRWKLALSPAKS